MSKEVTFLDLFAGAGGLSEGFIRAGYKPIAHVESDLAACNTLKTRMAYHYLKSQANLSDYNKYISGEYSRTEFYSKIPDEILNSVIHKQISSENNPQIFSDIDSLRKKKKIDIIIGGPPCQAYSLVGRSRDENNMLGDSRNKLYEFYAEYLEKYEPEYFIFENVLGLLSAKSEEKELYIDKIIAAFSELDYKTEYKVLHAKDYGVLQNRKRVIIFGSKNKDKDFPEPEKVQLKNTVVNEIFKDLPSLSAGEGTIQPVKLKSYTGEYLKNAGIRNGETTVTFHVARPNTKNDLEIYERAVRKWNNERERLNYNNLPKDLMSHKNTKSFTDRFKVVAGNLKFSHTVVAHISKDGHYYIHPDIHQNRSLTPREAARLQTFPDNYYFESHSEKPGRTAAFKQIGNAVPVLLAQKIAEKIKENCYE